MKTTEDFVIDTTESSNIARIVYKSDKKTLYITFKRGGTYRYDNVPANIALDLKNAESVGKFFQDNIKNKFNFSK